MKKKCLYLILSLCTLAGSALHADFKLPEKSPNLYIENALLIRIGGKTISVIDVKKRMDAFLFANHPEVLNSPLDCHQFYAKRWRHTLKEMIQDQLMVLEAEELKLKISDGDIHEEMNKKYGKNPIPTLEKLSLTLEEAEKQMKEEIMVRNMGWYRIWSHVMQNVTPESIKMAYHDYVRSLPDQDKWTYQMVTVRGSEEIAKEVAEKMHNIAQELGTSQLSDVVSHLNGDVPPSVTVSLSDDVTLSTHELSKSHLAVLKELSPNTLSEPAFQQSRKQASQAWRIFQLKEHDKPRIPTFEEMEESLKNQLYSKEAQKYSDAYFAKMRKHFCCEDLVVEKLFDANYQPFKIQ